MTQAMFVVFGVSPPLIVPMACERTRGTDYPGAVAARASSALRLTTRNLAETLGWRFASARACFMPSPCSSVDELAGKGYKYYTAVHVFRVFRVQRTSGQGLLSERTPPLNPPRR